MADQLPVSIRAKVVNNNIEIDPLGSAKLGLFTKGLQDGDVVIITSMMPSATPNQFTYVQTVNKTGIQTVFRANSLTRTWLTYGLQNVDDVIYLEDVSRVTETIVQSEIAPAVVDNTMSIGLEGNRSLISQVIVYNNSTGLLIDPADYRIEIENVAPILVIDCNLG